MKNYNAKDHSIADVDYTYCNYATGVTSIIDHFLLTECTFRSILAVKVSHSGANLSDHDPLLIELIPHQKLKLKKQQIHRTVQWYNASDVDYNELPPQVPIVLGTQDGTGQGSHWLIDGRCYSTKVSVNVFTSDERMEKNLTKCIIRFC